MSHEAARNTIVRLACFAGLWLVAFGVRLSQRNDPRMMAKVGLFLAFLVPTVLLFWLVQRAARYRIPWLVELFALPFATVAFLSAVVALRDLLGRTT